jgi:hypothetical protein
VVDLKVFDLWKKAAAKAQKNLFTIAQLKIPVAAY